MKFFTTDKASLPWEQQLAVAHCEQVGALCSARTPPWPAHRVCRLDSQRQSWEACEPRLCRRLSQEALYLTADGKNNQKRRKTVITANFSVSLTGSDGFQRNMHIVQWNVCSSRWAADERRMTGGQELKKWTARGWAKIRGLGVGQCRRARHCMLEERGRGGAVLPGHKSRHCCRHHKAAPSSCHLSGQTRKEFHMMDHQ